MKRDKVFTFLWSFLLSFCISLGAVGCLITAFKMHVSLPMAALWCAGGALFCSISYSLPLGPLPPSAFCLVCGLLWHQGALQVSTESLLYRLSRQYHNAYDWDIIKLNHLTADEMEMQLGLVIFLLGVLIAMGISWSLCRKRPSVFGMLPAITLLCACLVVTDTVPSMGFLYLLLTGVLLMLLTGAVRYQDPARGNRLTAWLAIPVALSLLILMAAIPANNYQGKEFPRKLVDQVMDSEPVARLFGHASEVGTTGSSVDSSIVNLKSVGVRLESNSEIMHVLTDYSGNLYLRGRGLDAYDGVSWSDSGTDYSQLNWPAKDSLKDGGEVMITTRYAHRMLYLPYYVQSVNTSSVSRGLENEKKLNQYSFSCKQFSKEDPLYLQSTVKPHSEDFSQYTHLTEEVKAWAVPLVQQITAGKDSVYEKAQAIREYVRSSARYDTGTYRMPSGSSDFARWFLEDSDTGYCVHFATATTVLLQAAGIPARYVTGYTLFVSATRPAVVRSKDAHAWAEYWLPGYGWVILESTPPEDAPPPTQAITEATEETQIATEPTTPSTPKPTEGSQPSSPEAPSITRFFKALWIIPILLAVIGLVFSQRALRLHLRKKRLQKASPNETALAYWQETVYLAHLAKEMPDKALFELAQKAKFSQHTITEEELAAFESSLAENYGKLKKRSVFHQIYYRLILVVY